MEGVTQIEQKRISLCVCGGIAAYKTVDLASRLTKLGYDVHVAMTPSAQQFVGSLTFQAITSNPVFTDLTDPSQEGRIGHIEFAQECDLLVVAPATANVLAKAALGLGDETVSTALLATNRPVLFAPAMNTEMWKNPATQGHVSTLRSRGFQVLEPGSGSLACGAVGPGRLPEPEELVVAIVSSLSISNDYAGKHVLITGGPTREFLDPVRFLSNPSSGKTALALAKAAASRGAKVTLVMGPTQQRDDACNVTRIDVTSAADMHSAVMNHSETADLIVMSAAVSDWTPVVTSEQKEKKTGRARAVEFHRTRDILAELGAHEHRSSFRLIGYAAETENIIENAREKCRRKNADLIIANDVSKSTLGFGTDQNEVHLVTLEGVTKLPKANKLSLAHQILDYVRTEIL